MQNPRTEDFKEFLKLLTENKVEYLIVGGYAVSFYSRPRYTDDLDVWINKSISNLHKFISVLKQFGFSEISIDENEFINKPKVYRIGNSPVRIEILNEIDGVLFDDAYKEKRSGKYEDLDNVYFISLEDLIKNKKAAGRIKDKLDLEYIETYKKK